jgi:predicted nucleotidyltransferase
MSFEKLLAKIAKLFNAAGIPYMLVGGFAVAYWGYPRQSLDIDIVADLSEDNINPFIKQAKKNGFLLHEREIKSMIKKGNRFVMEADDFRIDCWLPRTGFEVNSFKNRKRKKLFGQSLYIIKAEDLILAKLLAGRSRDIEDIRTILLRQGRRLSKNYLLRHALALNVKDSLDKIVKEAAS